MKYILEPHLNNYTLVKVDLNRLFAESDVKGFDRKLVEKAKAYIETHDEMYAPYIIHSQSEKPRFEGNHRLRALLELGYNEIEIGVPKDITKLDFFCMKIITSEMLKDFEGKSLKDDLTVGKSIATILGSSENKDPMRAYVLGQDFYREKEIDLNKSDLDFVKEVIKTNKGFSPIVTGQLLVLLTEKKEEVKPE